MSTDLRPADAYDRSIEGTPPTSISMLKRLLAAVRRRCSRLPRDPRVAALRTRLLRREDESGSPQTGGIVAVQCREDPFYFGLLGAVFAELRRQRGVSGELVVVHSISGAIGYGLRASLSRSSIARWLMSSQWERAFRPLITRIAYRSRSLKHPLGDSLDLLRSLILWRRWRDGAPSALAVAGVPVGDLIVDSYLRFRPSPQFDARDTFVWGLIWQAYRDVRRARAYFRRRQPLLYLTSYSSYIEHGIAARVALQEGVPVRCFPPLGPFGKMLALSDWYQTANTEGYRQDFAALDGQQARLDAAERELMVRLSGGIDVATSYMHSSAYANASVQPPAELEGATVVFLHDFYDSPHIYHDLVFDDFWVWTCFTIDTLLDAQVPFFLKPHPNQIALSDEALLRLRNRYPGLRFVAAEISNAQLVKAGIRCGVTMYGSVAGELAYFGIPSIACARHPQAAFDFCRTARTREQYAQLLRSPSTQPVAQDEMRRQSLVFYYMKNLQGDAASLALRADVAAYWKACHGTSVESRELMVRAYDRLRGSTGFQSAVHELLMPAEPAVPR